MEASRRTPAPRAWRALPLALALAFAPAAAGAAEWQQAAVQTLANELVKATQALFDKSYEDPMAPDKTGIGYMGNADNEYMDRVRLMRDESLHLQDMLSKGGGLGPTLPVYKRLRELEDDANMYSGMFAMQDDASDELAAVDGVLKKMSAYYAPHKK